MFVSFLLYLCYRQWHSYKLARKEKEFRFHEIYENSNDFFFRNETPYIDTHIPVLPDNVLSVLEDQTSRDDITISQLYEDKSRESFGTNPNSKGLV